MSVTATKRRKPRQLICVLPETQAENLLYNLYYHTLSKEDSNALYNFCCNSPSQKDNPGLGVGKSTFYRWVNGETLPHSLVRNAIAQHLGLKVTDVFVHVKK